MSFLDTLVDAAKATLPGPQLREMAARLYTAADEIEGPPSSCERGYAGETQHRVTERIRQLIARSSYRQNELAVAAGYAPDELSSFMTGKRRMDLEDLARIADVLDVDPFELFVEVEVL